MQDVVGHPALVITRNVEWGTVIFGFEQANKYTIYDQEGNVVALLAEELGSFGKEVGRQLLRTRRPFTATVFSPDGNIWPRLPTMFVMHSHALTFSNCCMAGGTACLAIILVMHKTNTAQLNTIAPFKACSQLLYVWSCSS